MDAPWESESDVSRSLLELIARDTNDGIWALNVETDAVYYSPRWLELLGFVPGELPGYLSTFMDRLHPDDHDRVLRANLDHQLGLTQEYRLEFRLRHKDGSWRQILTRGVVLRDAAGRAIRMVGIHTDVSDRAREAERLEGLVRERTLELQAALERAERNAAAAIRFLSAASHDIRQPLQATALLLGALAGDLRTERGRAAFDAIEGALAASMELLDSLLEFSRIEAGALEPSFTAVELGALVERSARPFAAEAAAKGLKLRTVASGMTVRTDPALLGRILRNLISNAVKYTDRGGVLVGCRRGGGKVRLEVIDTGRGIEEAERQRIFWEFYRVEPQRPAGRPGLGLGLAIAERLARILGHALTVDSVPGRGTRFAIELPEAGEPAAELPKSGLRVQAGSALAGKLVAVVDNEEQVAAALGRLLEEWGATPVVAFGGDALLAALGGRMPDLAIVDRHLDGEDGFALAARLEAACGHPLPVLILTGDYDIANLSLANRDRRRILQKPAMPAVLHAVLTAELDRAAPPAS